MRAELKSLLSWDVDSQSGDLTTFRPTDPADFGVGVAAQIGPAGELGEEQFQFTACSPAWLARQPLQKGFAFVRHTLVLDQWDPALIQRAIADLCRGTEAETWSDIAIQLSRFGLWELENYRT